MADKYHKADFDDDWVFWGTYDTWRGAMRVFVYPESQILPTLRPELGPLSATDPKTMPPYEALIANLRNLDRVTPARARGFAAEYLQRLRTESTDLPQPLKKDFEITEQLTDTQLAARQVLCATLMAELTDPHKAPRSLKEVFYFVPLLCALQLHRSGEYVAALDWFKTVYAYHLPLGRVTVLPAQKPQPDRRQIYYGLTLDERIPTSFVREADWPRVGLKSHDVARTRANALTRFTVISLVRCFEAFADTEFTRDTNESIARARALYQTALDLLDSVYPAPEPALATPIPPFQAAAATHYQGGTPDGKRPGRVSVAVCDATHRSYINDEAVAYHEGVPGHHLQITIEQSLTGLPEFRKHGGNSAYTEGWGLYAEQLGKEIGLYRDPGSDYGRLRSELFRAVRLVVDTGIHDMDWSRDQVVEYMRHSHAVDEPTIQSETDRYISGPGQACSYKLGQLKIRELRERAKQQLRAKFDLKAFHDEILAGGALPLDILDARVNGWIKAQLGAAAN